jgi:hypothetical protein
MNGPEDDQSSNRLARVRTDKGYVEPHVAELDDAGHGIARSQTGDSGYDGSFHPTQLPAPQNPQDHGAQGQGSPASGPAAQSSDAASSGRNTDNGSTGGQSGSPTSPSLAPSDLTIVTEGGTLPDGQASTATSAVERDHENEVR